MLNYIDLSICLESFLKGMIFKTKIQIFTIELNKDLETV